MIFWIIYFFSFCVISYVFSLLAPKKVRTEVILIFLIFFLTPSLIEISSNKFAPALFVFLFDLFLENNFSTRSLRSLLISIPIGSFLVILTSLLKRKFFESLKSQS